MIEKTTADIKYPLDEEVEPPPKYKIIGIIAALITIWINPDPIPLNAFNDTRSLLLAVMQFATHCIEMLTAVYAMPHAMYVTPHHIVFHPFGISRFKKDKQLNNAKKGAPQRIYGRNLPHLVCVFSAIEPNIGSFTASQIQAINIIAETTIGVSPTTSV